MTIEAIIPALDEEDGIGSVVRALAHRVVRVIVVDNGSTDATAARASEAGAHVVTEPRRGYGAACLAGIGALSPEATVVLFVDADAGPELELTSALVTPILEGRCDLVVGSRVLGSPQPGALTLPQRTGNALASAWLRRRHGLEATDLGPFRAIERRALNRLAMRDRDYGWTVEMQLEAARVGLRYEELPVPCASRRHGRSKVAGSLRGAIGAGVKILYLLARHELR